ncbi:ECF-type sigma factor [Paludisphaera mucosa]|uniref:ECF-type sigma factor n=1 Tax=Paludisphaera mucosa TaxID=3030827 RepID=A0ABT6FLB5_9BACT|nr:ECF-type sigma factor [Paludisphaera mucosa]MDG3008291.1 ECF-type sigma factor [Paludisphaera mucosa]
MTTEAFGSISQWLDPLRRGDHAAAQPLWERYYGRLVRLARAKLAGGRGLDHYEEDVALSAFDSFVQAVAAGRFPKLVDRDDLWRSLFEVTARKAVNLRKHHARLKRGQGRVLDEAALAGPEERGGLDGILGDEPTPELAAALAEGCRVLLAALDREDPTFKLRRIALWKLEGFTNQEIADKLGYSRRTIAAQLNWIRSAWEGFREP